MRIFLPKNYEQKKIKINKNEIKKNNIPDDIPSTKNELFSSQDPKPYFILLFILLFTLFIIYFIIYYYLLIFIFIYIYLFLFFYFLFFYFFIFFCLSTF